MTKHAPTPPPGTFLLVSLPDGSFGYGRVRHTEYAPIVAFYRLRTEAAEQDFDVIEQAPVLFSIAVRGHHAFATWKSLGHKALSKELSAPFEQFMQDLGRPEECVIFDTAGNERSVTPQECQGLERAAVWEAKNAEKRLWDALHDRANDEAERLKVRLG